MRVRARARKTRREARRVLKKCLFLRAYSALSPFLSSVFIDPQLFFAAVIAAA